MPGILPMKVIKVGTSAQSRIAQACDRCRSKKIRCDGITPCCTQCANVGFECKTSDKLSRRAFPRGYTESLEERVRSLEGEVKELKDLLDEKDEKIDILSRVRLGSRRPSSTLSSSPVTDVKPIIEVQEPEEDTFRVQQSPSLLDAENADSSYFMDAFKLKVQESGKPCADFKTQTFFTRDTKSGRSPNESPRRPPVQKVPPRLAADQLVNIFFQEWAPLFPVLHRPTFLELYTNYVGHADAVRDQHSLAQLHLVFGIAASSAEWNKQNAGPFESQWQAALDSILSAQTLATLQCLVLAQMYCIAKSDYSMLLHYKGMAISLSHRLGLHQSQKRFSLGALTVETRKRVFWSLYTLDCFSAALLGLPKLLNDSDIHAEYPADVDDENVSERGFQSTLPGESTRLSNALALFRISRILSKVLVEIYPAASSHDLSLQKIGGLSDELDSWQNGLPSHLRLQFVQGKPSANIVGSRSLLLSLAYYYVRTLIHRPAVGSSLGPKASSSIVALASSSKHIIQIIRLLEERRMSFSFCLNKNELLLLAGFGLLYQGLDLGGRGKLIEDSQRLMCSTIDILERSSAPGAADFKKAACAVISIDRFSQCVRALDDGGAARVKSESHLPSRKTSSKATRKQLQAIGSRFSPSASLAAAKKDDTGDGRRTAPDVGTRSATLSCRSNSQDSASSVVSDPTQQYGRSEVGNTSTSPDPNSDYETPNLDYLSFNHEPGQDTTFRGSFFNPPGNEPSTGFNSNQHLEAPYSSLFPSPDVLSAYMSPPLANCDWASDLLALPTDFTSQPTSANSVLSFSEDDLTSGEDLSTCDMSAEYRGLNMPSLDDFGEVGRLDGNLGL
ncbi:MAG: hypothetical protein Q9191_003000 [Dirinaria sp. TL-2023a]